MPPTELTRAEGGGPVVLVVHIDLFAGAVHSPYLLSLVRSLPRFRFVVLTDHPAGGVSLDAWPPNVSFLWRRGIWIHRVQSGLPVALARLFGGAAEVLRGFQNRFIIRRTPCEVIHVHAAMDVENLLRIGMRFRLTALWVMGRWLSDLRWTGKPVLFTEHSQFSRRGELGFPNPLHPADLVVSEAYPNVVCVDRDAYRYLGARDVSRRFVRQRWFVPNGIDADAFRYQPFEERSTLRIGYAGRLFRRGESRSFLPNVARALPKGTELHLAVALDRSADDIKSQWFPDSPVTVRMNVPNQEMPAFYGSIDLLVNPLLWGGVGRNSLEAMSCGRPVAMFDNADRYPITEENGYLLPAEDTEAFLSLVERVARNRKELKVRGEQGRALVQREFDQSRVASAMGEIYESLLSADAGTSAREGVTAERWS